MDSSTHFPEFNERGDWRSQAAGFKQEVATLAGGCFWGMQELFRSLPGVINTQVGYTGGTLNHATYPGVRAGNSGHAEAIQILFDPQKTHFKEILLFFFKAHDPTQKNRQGGDIGSQYRSSIFFESDVQKVAAVEVMSKVERSGKWGAPLVTEVVSASAFWRAEEDHQKYLIKNQQGYTCHFIRPMEF